MKEPIKPVFSTTPLDARLLAAAFAVQTRWHVITGAPSCGKSTLIDLLSEKGFCTAPEIARVYMEAEIERGRTIEEIRANVIDLQRELFKLQMEAEGRMPAKDVIFLDVAVPGSMAWYRLFGLDPNEILPACFQHRYASVFMLDPLPIRLDGLRFDDEAITIFLDDWQMRDYRALGYEVARVPVLPPEERLAWVLEKLSVRGLL